GPASSGPAASRWPIPGTSTAPTPASRATCRGLAGGLSAGGDGGWPDGRPPPAPPAGIVCAITSSRAPVLIRSGGTPAWTRALTAPWAVAPSPKRPTTMAVVRARAGGRFTGRAGSASGRSPPGRVARHVAADLGLVGAVLTQDRLRLVVAPV